MSNPSASNSKKIALITGTSTGIGLSTAVVLAQSGFTVVATMRDLAKAALLETSAKAANVTLDIRQLDVQSDSSVNDCVQSVLTTYGKIDLLVNNAGAGFLGALEQTSFSDLQNTMDVNFYGVWRVTQAVFPVMRAAQSGRILTVTSVGGLMGQPFNDAYCAAKFAVEGWMECFAPVAKRFGVSVSVVEPGPVNTEFVSSVLKGLKPAAPDIAEIYRPMVEAYYAATQQVFANNGQTGDDIARVILEAATADTPHFRYMTSDTVRGGMSRKYVDVTGDSVIMMTGARLS